LLAGRSGLKDRLGFYRHLMLDICQTITASKHDLSVLNHCQRDAGNLLFLHLRPQVLIDLALV
jgi:hypothetical protein